MNKIKEWIVSHKVITIIIASVLAVGIALSIALPLALAHRTHTFVDKHNDTHYWLECSECGLQKDKFKATLDDPETEIANAVQFKDAEGEYYSNLKAECTGYYIAASTATRVDVVKKIVFTSDKYYTYNCGVGVGQPLEDLYVNEDSGCSRYTKENADKKWERISQDGHYSANALLASARNIIYRYGIDNFNYTYNTENNTYSATKLDGSTSIKVIHILKFANGKLVNMELDRVNSSNITTEHYSWTVSYGNASIEIPSDGDLATVPYITSKFILENVTLSKNTTRWFAIDISSDMFTGDSTDIQVMFTPSSGSTLPTLTFEIETTSDTEIEDESDTNGTGYFSGLSAGRCYIKVKASEACTGSLSVVIA